MGRKRKDEKKAPKKIFGALIVFVITGLLAVLGLDQLNSGPKEVKPLEVYFIDLGKYDDNDCGESIYMKLGDIDILVDAGDRYEATKRAITEVIDQNSEDKIIDYVIATHPDADHIGSMDDVFETYQIKNLLHFAGTHTSTTYQDYLTAVNNENLISQCSVVDAINNVNGCNKDIKIVDDVYIKIIDTNHYEIPEPNGRSIVCVIEAYGTRMLLTGDADNGSDDVEDYYNDLIGDIDILKAVHHGTKEGTTLELLNNITPEVVIITNGNYFGNKHGHPSPDAINRIYQNNSQTKVYAVVGGDADSCSVTSSGSYECDSTNRFIDRNGTIKITIDNNGYIIKNSFNEDPIEISSTEFWVTNPQKLYEYGN